MSGNRKFWRKARPYFNNKGLNSYKSLLSERDNLVYSENKLASIFNDYSTIVTSNLELRNPPTDLSDLPQFLLSLKC